MAEIPLAAPADPAAAPDASVGARLRAARVALVLLPLLFVVVVALNIWGQRSQAALIESQRPAVEAEAPPLSPAMREEVLDSLPDDISEAQREAALERVREAMRPRDAQAGGPRGRGQRGGGGGSGRLLGLSLVAFVALSALAALFGFWALLSSRQRGWVRGAAVVFVPLMVLTGLATTGLALVAINTQPEEQRRPFNTLAVMADRATRDDVVLSITTQGETQPQVEIDLVPEVGGKIVFVSPSFIEGGIFSRGDTLVRIDPADFEVAVVSAQANLANARQVLAREEAEARLAEQDVRDLGISNASQLALRQPQLEQARASVAAAEAEVERARLQLQRTNVRAPFSGRVRSKSADIGQFVAPGTPLGRIFSTDVIQVRLPLTDADLAKIDLPLAFVAPNRESAPRVVLSATIAGEVREWEGRIMRTDASYDRQTRALFAIVEVADPYGAGASESGVPLAPGLFVDARVEGRALEDMVVLPRAALRPRNEVYVVDGEGRAEIRTASVVDTDPTRAVIRPGVVEAGELVVVSPMERSRIETPLQVLDVNDPATVLVQPRRENFGRAGAGAGAGASADRGAGRGNVNPGAEDDAPASRGDGATEGTDDDADDDTDGARVVRGSGDGSRGGNR